jgi:tetratricopeptide (TPR) repeat protein
LFPQHPNILYGKYDEEIKMYDKVLNIEPRNFDALNGKGAAFIDLHKPDDALIWLNKALEIEPQNSFVLWTEEQESELNGDDARCFVWSLRKYCLIWRDR